MATPVEQGKAIYLYHRPRERLITGTRELMRKVLSICGKIIACSTLWAFAACRFANASDASVIAKSSLEVKYSVTARAPPRARARAREPRRCIHSSEKKRCIRWV